MTLKLRVTQRLHNARFLIMANRLQYRFWLNADKDDELLLTAEIDRLKAERSFVGTIRDGIRLIIDLRQKRVGVLFELFPWIKSELPTPPEPDKDKLMREIEMMKQLLLANFSDNGLKMAERTKVIPFHAPRPSIAKLPPTPPPVEIEVDTSSSFLDMF